MPDARPFQVVSENQPAGDQPQAIERLAEGVLRGDDNQTLLGVTGTGKTFTIANVIAKVRKPTLVIAPNKSLAAQLANEFREVFPHNAVEYFVSYYDYYQPDAYVPHTHTYIEKDSSITDEIAAIRIELWGDQVERLIRMDTLTGEILGEMDEVTIYPATHYVTSEDRMRRAIQSIEGELEDRLGRLERENKLLEAQRLRMRT